MKKTLLFFTGLFLFISLSAQTRVIKGQVTTFNRFGVANLEVVAKKAKASVTTDIEGRFELVCQEKDIIQIKGKVFNSITKRVGPDDDFFKVNLVFKDSPKNREIATGYGYVSAENLTFALANLIDENNDFCNYSDVFEIIKSRFPGVVIKATDGGKGVFVRGQKSIYGDNEAIYVVDEGRVADVSWVQPCEVTSITVLKDGGAALYGSAAANGVVVIETKGNSPN
jgi:TonB-dependent SusC/RagA subfamily outer membrane receptor